MPTAGHAVEAHNAHGSPAGGRRAERLGGRENTNRRRAIAPPVASSGPAARAPIRVEAAPGCPRCGRPGDPLHHAMQDRMGPVHGRWSLARCRDCGIAWLDPRPVAEDLGRLYEGYFTHAPPAPPAQAEGWRGAVRGAALHQTYGYPVVASTPPLARAVAAVPMVRDKVGDAILHVPFVPVGRLLDVGCGNGGFLLRMQALGWRVEGVEPDPRAAHAAREATGAAVHASVAAARQGQGPGFDAVAANHVVEHVADPAGMVHDLAGLLRPGGWLALVTPNLGSKAHALFGAAWRHLDPPRHLVLLPLPSLVRMVEEAGLTVARASTRSPGLLGSWAASDHIARTGRLDGAPPRPRLGMVVRALAHGLAWPGREGGEETYLLARKPGGEKH
jgi:hypothetical protein